MTSCYTTHSLNITNPKDKLVGACGPCTCINLFQLPGNHTLEKNLSELGRTKPFQISFFSSFLLWAHKYNKKIEVYISDYHISDRLFEIMWKYEGVDGWDKRKSRHEAQQLIKHILQKHSKQVHRLHNHPVDKMDELLSQDYEVAFLIAESDLIPHWRMCFKKEADAYFIKDSNEGLMRLNRSQLEKQFAYGKKAGCNYELVAYKR